MNSGVLSIIERMSGAVSCLAEAICSGRAGDVALAVFAIIKADSDF